MKSKKLWATMTGIASVVLVNFFGLDEETARTVIAALAAIAGSFNIGQGIADGLSGGKTSSAFPGSRK